MFPVAAALWRPCWHARTCLSVAANLQWPPSGHLPARQRFSQTQTSGLLCGHTFLHEKPTSDLLRQQPLHAHTASLRPLHTSLYVRQAAEGRSSQTNEQLLSQMNIRLVNENSFLSWCRNAYMSTVVGVAMMAEGTSALAQSAGLGALLVGTMNLAWGTGCHVTNLVRLRHVSGMSSVTLVLHVAGACLHCVLWAFVLVCFIGFLDESRSPPEDGDVTGGDSADTGNHKRLLRDDWSRV